jgi:nucleotide-binding universal stress UspA family protein
VLAVNAHFPVTSARNTWLADGAPIAFFRFMLPITKILVPVDLSARSLGAAAYAKPLAASLGAELVFLHVVRHIWPLGEDELEFRDRIHQTAGSHRFLFRRGSPAPVIVQTAAEERVKLIVMATHASPVLTRVFDGSTTAQVQRQAPCPVWVGVDNLWPLSARPIQSIVCGVSVDPHADSVLRWSANIANQLHARLTVIDGRETSMDLDADLLVIGKSPRKRFLADVRTQSYEIACRMPCPVATV